MTQLDDLLRRLAKDESRIEAPARLERAVLAAWDAEHPSAPAPRHRRRMVVARWGALAAGLSMAVAAGWYSAPGVPAPTPRLPAAPAMSVAVPRPPARGDDVSVVVENARHDVATPVMHRAGTGSQHVEPVEREATTVVLIGEPLASGEMLRLVRMRAPTSALTALGLRPTRPPSAEHVDLDVFVGEDGVARAVRLGM